MKSSSSVGPRRPALREFWLSATFTPWLVVSARPPESTRTRSSEAVVGLEPAVGLPEPSLGDALLSLSVLPLTAGSDGLNELPVAATGGAPNSDGLAALKGNFAARASVPASFAVAASFTAVVFGRCDGLLTVLRAELRAGPAAGEPFWIFFGCGCA